MNCIFSAALSVSGCLLFSRGAYILFMLNRIKNWKKINVNFIDFEVLPGFELIRYGFCLEYYYPAVTYEYEVNGKKVCSNKVALEKKGIWMESYKEAQKLLNTILVDSMAFYNPDNINESVIVPYLTKRRASHNWSLVVSGMMLIGLGIMFCLISA